MHSARSILLVSLWQANFLILWFCDLNISIQSYEMLRAVSLTHSTIFLIRNNIVIVIDECKTPNWTTKLLNKFQTCHFFGMDQNSEIHSNFEGKKVPPKKFICSLVFFFYQLLFFLPCEKNNVFLLSESKMDTDGSK